MVPEIKRILYATDLSEHSRKSLAWSMALARKHDALLLMLNVIEDFSATPSIQIYFTENELAELRERINNEAVDIMKNRLHEFCEDVKSEIPGCTHVADEIIVRRGNPVEKIIQSAKEHRCDIIVMGSLGTGGLAGAIMGSTARRVLRRSKLPVFVVPIG
jgi:nucleotide-binding universal stress UspA family protein